MKYLNKSFTLPAANPGQDADEWEGIFGTEEERKAKMAIAVEETKQRKKARKSDIVQLVGDATDGFTSAMSEDISRVCEQYRIPVDMVKSKTREVFEKNANILKRGGNILKDDK